jgi:CHAT domain-containing protein
MLKKTFKIFIILIFPVLLIADPLSENSEEVISKFYDLVYEERYEEASVMLPQLTEACNKNQIEFQAYVYCKTAMISGILYGRFEDTTEDLVDDALDDIDIIFLEIEGKTYTSEEFLWFASMVLEFIPKYYLNVTVERLEDFVNALDMKEKGSSIYKAQWNELKAEISFFNGDMDSVIKYTRQELKEYKKFYSDEVTWEILDAKIRLAKAFIDNDNEDIKEAKELIIQLINFTNFDEFPTYHLLAWDILSTIEMLYGSLDDEIFARSVFFEKYFYTNKTLKIWNAEVDNVYLDKFPYSFSGMSCSFINKSIEEFNELKVLRSERYGNAVTIDYGLSEIAILHESIGCSEDIREIKNLQNRLHNILSKQIKDLYYPDEFSNFLTLVTSLDFKNRRTINLHNKFIKKFHTILDEILLQGDEDIEFDQFLVGTLSKVLIENLKYQSKKNQIKSMEYIEFLANKFMEHDPKNTNSTISIAYQSLFYDFTTGLIEQGFEDKAINIYLKYLKSINKKYAKQDLYILSEMNLLAESEVLINALLIKKKKNTNENTFEINIDSLLNNLNFIDKNPIEFSLILNKKLPNESIKQVLSGNIKNNNLRDEFLNKELITDGKEVQSFQALENQFVNYNLDLFELSQKDRSIIDSILYPEITLEKIQGLLTKDESIISYSIIELNEADDLLIGIGINRTNFQIYIKRIDAVDFVNKLKELDQSIRSYNPNHKSNNHIILADELSKILLDGLQEVYKDKKKISFLSNFLETMNANLLRENKSWLVEYTNINYFLSWAGLLDRGDFEENNTKNKYIGYGDIDFTNHVQKYTSLSETRQEILTSSQFFKESKEFFGQRVSEKEIFSTKHQNSIVHFATHNSTIEKSNFFSIPALVIYKDEESDGYLDVFDIQSIDYKNSDIILSACSTTDSIENNDDAFSGLIKSFKISGAKSIMATRWDIESYSAVEFSSKYINLLSQSVSSDEAVSNIQRSFIESDNYNHPFFWGGYVAISN